MVQPTRIGDIFTFIIPDQLLPPGQPFAYESLGSLPVDSYHIIMTGDFLWQDPSGDPTWQSIYLGVDLDAYDVNDNIIDWDSGLYPRVLFNYLTHDSDKYNQPIITQSVITIPQNTTLKLQLSDQSSPALPNQTTAG